MKALDQKLGRRGRGHERFGESAPFAAGPVTQQLALGRRLAQIGVGDLGDRLGRVVDARRARAQQDGRLLPRLRRRSPLPSRC